MRLRYFCWQQEEWRGVGKKIGLPRLNVTDMLDMNEKKTTKFSYIVVDCNHGSRAWEASTIYIYNLPPVWQAEIREREICTSRTYLHDINKAIRSEERDDVTLVYVLLVFRRWRRRRRRRSARVAGSKGLFVGTVKIAYGHGQRAAGTIMRTNVRGISSTKRPNAIREQ